MLPTSALPLLSASVAPKLIPAGWTRYAEERLSAMRTAWQNHIMRPALQPVVTDA